MRPEEISYLENLEIKIDELLNSAKIKLILTEEQQSHGTFFEDLFKQLTSKTKFL